MVSVGSVWWCEWSVLVVCGGVSGSVWWYEWSVLVVCGGVSGQC